MVDAYCNEPGHGMGGSLHIVLDDGNVDNGSLEWCQDWAKQHNDPEGVKLANMLLRMSTTQRRKLSKMRYGRR